MTDITEDLRQYKELRIVYIDNPSQILDAILEEDEQKLIAASQDPRIDQYLELYYKLKEIAIKHDAVSITDPTLHRVFHEIRIEAFDDEIHDNGDIVSDDLFYGIIDQHRPEQVLRNLKDTKPLVSLNRVPAQVESLVSETREAYSLGLPTACISLCRSTVERAIVDIAVRSGRVQDEDCISEMGMCDRISLLIDKSVSRSSPLRQQINEFMATSSNVIHSNVEADMPLALKLYHDSIALIQALYGQYKSQIKR